MSSERLVDNSQLDAPGDLNELENSLREAVTSESKEPEKAQSTETEQQAEKPDWIPDKFWTGSFDESVKKLGESYDSLQSAYGRMANDLGTQRKLTDRLLAMDKRSEDLDEKPRELPKVDPSKLVDNPSETLEEWYSTRRKQEAEEEQTKSHQNRMAELEQEFNTKHSDWQEVTTSDDFSKWVQESPLRVNTAAYAGQGDFASATALLDEYKAAQKAATSSQRDDGDDVDAARKASLESAAQSDGGTSKTAGKIYRRADLIQLKLEKPNVYSSPEFQEEILRAYSEGRVK